MAESKKSWFSKIENRSEALKQLKNCSIGFLILGVWTAVVSVIANPVGLVDAILIIVATFYMYMHHSRVAVFLLLAVALYGFVGRFATFFGLNLGLERDGLLIPALILIMAIRSVEAVMVINKQKSATEP